MMWIPFILLGVLLFVCVVSYNQLIRFRNLMQEALSGVDVQLKRRYDLIPNIVSAVKGYRDYETDVLQSITQLRSESITTQSLNDAGQKQSDLSQQIKKIFLLAEAYPDLKANQNFLTLQNNLIEIEDQIQLARRYYNGTVRDYNIQADSFPQVFIARIFNFSKAEFFELEYATERKTPDVKFT